MNNTDNNDNNDDDYNHKKYDKFLTAIKLYSAFKQLKYDNEPDEILSNALYLGSISAAMNKETLLHNKIHLIIIAARDIKHIYPDNFIYFQFNLLDSETEYIKKYFNQSNELIHSTITKGRRVFVHCHAGISRSATLVIAYLMKYCRMSFNGAFSYVKSKRNKINPNPGFIKQLKEYEEELGCCLGKTK